MGYNGGQILKQHLRFDRLPLEKGKKMYKYLVINETLRHTIGFIHFRGGWRQYVYQAYDKVDMTRSCHKEIDDFIDKLMNNWRNELKEKRQNDK